MATPKQNDLITHHIIVKDSLEEIRQHGNVTFPFAVYPVEFCKDYNSYIRWHWHNEIEFIYVESGEAKFLVGDAEYLLSKGQGLFINANTMHSVTANDGKECFYYSIVFHPNLVTGTPESGLYIKYMNKLLHSEDIRYIVLDDSVSEHALILKYYQSMIELDKERPFAYELQCKILLLQVWIQLLSYLNTTFSELSLRNSQQSIDETRVKKAIDYIESHYSEQITLEDIATSIHVSVGECCRCFKRCLKLSPFEYLMRYRIFIATNLIYYEKTASLSSIACSAGFNSSSYFNKLFRKYVGCTPTQYRKDPTRHQKMQDQHFLVPFI